LPDIGMNDINGVINLRAGRAELGVAPGIGGSIAHYRWIDGPRAHDWLRPTAREDLLPGTADRLACFPLVPFSNRIRDGRFDFGGHAIRLPLNQWPQPHAEHGHGWQHPWDVVERAADRLALEFDHPADAWPFAYRARQEFVLTEDELRVTLSAENRGGETMPVGLGLHPYFPRTPRCRLSARVDAMWATDDEVMPTALTGADPRLADGNGMPVAATVLDNAFTGWRREATIEWPEHRARLRIEADPPLDFLVVYTPAAEDYFCAEPVSHCTDAFNLAVQGRSDTGMLTLDSGAILPVSVRFRPSVM
jgi:aldose 1-epimerase